MMDRFTETIKCPICGTVQKAEVIVSFPFNIYIHNCWECDYKILESEWEAVDGKETN